MQSFSYMPRFGILGAHPPTQSGLATFSAALADGLTAKGAAVSVVRAADESVSVQETADLLNQNDVALVQHDYGIYGGSDGDDVLEIMRGLRVPSIVIANTVLKDPTPHQRSVLEEVVALADQVIVMSEAARERLSADYAVDRHKIVTIPRGATVAGFTAQPPSDPPTILTWGLLAPGKGVERMIEAMGALKRLPNPPRYLIAGATHPQVLAEQGEAYRESLIEKARRVGVADLVSFDAEYRDPDELTALIQAAAVVVLPYDSRDQVVSGALVDSVASGRPVVATAFPHAVELLGGGAGIVVAHDDPEALVDALRTLLTDPSVAGQMAGKAGDVARTMAWPIVADAYLGLGRRLVAARLALT
jgi:glycosyltransferase involved in cell wall biosynthesis